MPRKRMKLAVAVAVTSLTWTGSAGADVVFGSKKPCPPGSAGQLSHTGPWCAPVACTADAECESFFDRDRSDKSVKAPKEPMACADHGLCVKTEKVKQMGGWAGGQTITKEIAVSVCGPSGACAEGTCSRAKRCIPTRLAGGGPGTAPTSTATTPPSAGDAGPTTAPDAGAAEPDDGAHTPPPPPTSAASAEPASGGPPPESSSCGRCAAGVSPMGDARLAALLLPLFALAARRRRRSAR